MCLFVAYLRKAELAKGTDNQIIYHEVENY